MEDIIQGVPDLNEEQDTGSSSGGGTTKQYPNTVSVQEVSFEDPDTGSGGGTGTGKQYPNTVSIREEH